MIRPRCCVTAIPPTRRQRVVEISWVPRLAVAVCVLGLGVVAETSLGGGMGPPGMGPPGGGMGGLLPPPPPPPPPPRGLPSPLDNEMYTAILNSSFSCPDTRFLGMGDSGTNVSNCDVGYSAAAAPDNIGWAIEDLVPTTVEDLLAAVQGSGDSTESCFDQVQGNCTAPCTVSCPSPYEGHPTELTCGANGMLSGTVRLCVRLTRDTDVVNIPHCSCDGPFPSAGLFSCEREGVQVGAQCQVLNHDGTCPSLGCYRYCRRDIRASQIRFWEFTAPTTGIISAMSLPANIGPLRYLHRRAGRVGRVVLTSPSGCDRELDPLQDWRLEDGRSAFPGRYNISISVYDAVSMNSDPISLSRTFRTNPALEVGPSPPATFVVNQSTNGASWPISRRFGTPRQLRNLCGTSLAFTPTVEIPNCRLASYVTSCVNGTGTPPYSVQRNLGSVSADQWPDGISINSTTGDIVVVDENALTVGVYNVSIVVSDGSQSTASTSLRIVVLGSLRVEAPEAPWNIQGSVSERGDDTWDILEDADAGPVTFFRGDEPLTMNDLNTDYDFVGCPNADADETVSFAMSPRGVLSYSGFGNAILEIYLYDTRANGPQDVTFVGNVSLNLVAPTRPPTPHDFSRSTIIPRASSSSEKPADHTALIVGIVVPTIVILVLVGFWVFDRRNRRKITMMESFTFPIADAWEYDRGKLIIGAELGAGAFGVVHRARAPEIRGEVGNVTVAVKECSEEKATVEDMQNFVREADLMKMLSHRNVISLLGVCMQDHPLLLITEIMEKGDLKDYLRGHRRISVDRLMAMSQDISEGLSYLATQHKFVHRDLACRNCLLDRHFTVKIGDFGMTRANTYKDYYKMNARTALLPVRWMAPEALSTALFSASSDVWSLGIVMWEITSFCEMPYPAMGNEEVFSKVRQGFRLPKPAFCPEPLYNVMLQCWDQDPAARPTAAVVASAIQSTREHWKPRTDSVKTDDGLDDDETTALIDPLSDNGGPAAMAAGDTFDSRVSVFGNPISPDSTAAGHKHAPSRMGQFSFYSTVPARSAATVSNVRLHCTTGTSTDFVYVADGRSATAPVRASRDETGDAIQGAPSAAAARDAAYSSISYGSEGNGDHAPPTDAGYSTVSYGADVDGMSGPVKSHTRTSINATYSPLPKAGDDDEWLLPPARRASESDTDYSSVTYGDSPSPGDDESSSRLRTEKKSFGCGQKESPPLSCALDGTLPALAHQGRTPASIRTCTGLC
eukprot:CAMPEP_0206328744 /NCGR_PEP_ID=MMETSP0106_2-20121207/22835_1 /ASSEMBLY_ACC=CAM_ASM_000206 /TAXON_ID=81532 /ORGANISM="Acanthoeca-like sp., Strain 10tr" /LENGTH=1239 /DNA_ID=CAMNT_0053761429 /DNA_START=189 /DNA_END=3906 /DNA_ORIENTATION=-